MNSENGKTSEPYRLLLNLTNKIKLKRSDMLLYQILVCTIHGNFFKKSYKKNRFKISAPTWYEKFELPDGSYSISDIQDYLNKS